MKPASHDPDAFFPATPGKTRITIRLDDDVLEWFRRRAHQGGGGNYQTLINLALHEYIEQRHEALEDAIRRVVREELREAAEKQPGRAGRSPLEARAEIDRLIETLRAGADEAGRAAAARALARAAPAAVALPPLLELLDGAGEALADAAAEALVASAAKDESRVVATLLEALASPERPVAARERAAAALARVGSAEALRPLARALADPSVSEAAAAAFASVLAHRRDVRAEAYLRDTALPEQARVMALQCLAAKRSAAAESRRPEDEIAWMRLCLDAVRDGGADLAQVATQQIEEVVRARHADWMLPPLRELAALDPDAAAALLIRRAAEGTTLAEREWAESALARLRREPGVEAATES